MLNASTMQSHSACWLLYKPAAQLTRCLCWPLHACVYVPAGSSCTTTKSTWMCRALMMQQSACTAWLMITGQLMQHGPHKWHPYAPRD